MKPLPLARIIMLVIGVAGIQALADGPAPTPIPKYGLVELSLPCPHQFDNPFRDAMCAADFVSPSGATNRVEGFYDGEDQWKVRFVPREHGNWTWTARISGGANPVTTTGSFECKGTQGHGFLRISKRNPFRYEYEDGTPFYPIGIQTCNFLRPDFDGPDAAQGPSRHVSNTQWVQAFTGAVNLVRTQFGQGTTSGCALPLIAVPRRSLAGTKREAAIAPDRYDLALAAKMDAVYKEQRNAGLSQILILFQDMSMWGDSTGAFGHIRDLKTCKSLHAANLPLQDQYLRYIIARYGAFVDIWELFNEDSFAPADYLAHLAGVLRTSDPYRHLLTTNYERPGTDWCDLTTWHEYVGMPAHAVDTYLVSQIALLKTRGKLVQNTEFGNQNQLSNYDPVKWRLAVWSAFMHESGILFWSDSQIKMPPGYLKHGNANAYIGPDSRQHFRVFHHITQDLPVDLRPVSIGYTEQTDLRAYALCNGQQGLIYLHHFSDHNTAFRLPYKLLMQTGPGTWRLRWIRPEDGHELKTETISTPQQYLAFPIPDVTIDMAARLERIGEPDDNPR